MLSLCRGFLAIGRAIVPSAVRDDWTREWRAELHYRTARHGAAGFRARLDLVVRCAGAVVHAAWLRKEEWSLSMLLHDLRDAFRSLRSRPGFTAACVLILAIGMGANAAVFAVFNGVLLAPLPYRDPDRLVQIWETNPSMNWTHATVAPANLLDWRERNQSFEGIAYYLGADGKSPGVQAATLTGFGEPERVRSMTVSGNFFDVLGVRAALGRMPGPPDALPDRAPAIVLSHGFWQRRFGGDPSIVGRRIDVDGVATEVAGVALPGFHVPGADVDYWAPHQMPEERLRRIRRAHWFRTVGRLKPGVPLDAARADLARIATDLEREYPDTNTQMGVGLGPLHDWVVGDVRRAMAFLLGAVALVLLITCSNVASLLLARATGRRREVGIRVALGAGRVRLVRQLLTESLILAIAAGAMGLALGLGAVQLVKTAGAANLPRLQQIAVDGRLLLFFAAIVGATTVLFGLVPAWQSARAAAADSLKTGARGSTGEAGRLRHLLIVGEVALSVVLLAGAGLLVRSFVRLQAVDPGVDVRQTLSFRVSLPDRYDGDGRSTAFFSELTGRLRAVPGVRAAGATARLALEGYAWTGDLFIEGRPEVRGRELRHKSVTPGYFEAAGIPRLAGRDFTGADTADSQPVALVNRALVRRYFAPADAVGSRISYSRPSGMETNWVTIIGVVADEKQDALDAPVEPEVYAPHTQDPRSHMSVLVRAAVDPAGLLPSIRREVAAVDPAIALYGVRTMEEVVRASVAEERFSALLLGAFALTALLLAAAGLYGVIAYTVSERTREIGVRLALGAAPSQVVRMVVGGGVRLVLAGLVVGLGAALLTGRVLEGFLFETRSGDPLVLGGVALTMLVTALAASYLPALRAARVDPAVSLRE